MFRALGDDEDGRRAVERPEGVPLEVWLDEIALRRDVCIQMIRFYEKNLVRYGRLRAFSFPQRER